MCKSLLAPGLHLNSAGFEMRTRLKHGNLWQAKRALLLFSVLLLSRFGASADIHPQSGASAAKSASAVLHVSVTVMPTIQAASISLAAPQTGQVMYRLETAPREQMYETRILPPDVNAQVRGERPAILKTLVVVPQ